MKVGEALEMLKELRHARDRYRGLAERAPNHSFMEDISKGYRALRDKIQLLEKAIYSQELDDSYDQNTGELNELYEEFVKNEEV